ncbi:SDR family NAD(P)-dependent oxidoreductase [Roseibacillus ishigakijimensis]|uniref:SDR family NAD(P)-dependent oxidoreductase n=1 Tax=Roseibacillus ishigakijimensis TaxID=454146 RepID=A0A934VMX9_9BACT|nr:SDR family NAD(P)-dependent oxidoreductase [Roseibacillus ishigakijimensis]MBK1834556.1 SDR family NAD(P)-dependent oxidoreductase [Roseibacillus ishigakijimensis]
MNTTVIIGASSALGEALVRLLAEQGEALFLTGRDEAKLAKIAEDARLRGAARVRTRVLDLQSWDGSVDFLREVGQLAAVVLTPGILSDEEGDFATWQREVLVNFTAVAYLARESCSLLGEQRKGGCLQVVGSVAGDRGRQSNGFYGAQKAALATYLEALAHRAALEHAEVRVQLIKPGMVRSAMTAHLPDSPLFSPPEAVAAVMAKALRKRKRGVFYAPSWWRAVMTIIRLVPGVIFKKTKL